MNAKRDSLGIAHRDILETSFIAAARRLEGRGRCGRLQCATDSDGEPTKVGCDESVGIAVDKKAKCAVERRYDNQSSSSNGDHASVRVIAALDVRMRSILRANSCRHVVVVVGGGA